MSRQSERMKITFVRPELRHLDGVNGEIVALPVFSDERPLRGVPGLVDWRLNGALSRWITRERFTGAPGETLLYPDRARLSFERVLLFGLGPAAKYRDAEFQRLGRQMLAVIRDMGLHRFAAPVPGRHALAGNPRLLVEGWLAAVREVFADRRAPGPPPEVLILEDNELQRSTAETVQGFLKRLAHGG